MAKRYTRLNFQNSPSVATPLNATNLNKIDKGIDDCDNAIEDLYSIKFDKANIANNVVTTAAGFALDARQGKVLQDQITAQNNNFANYQLKTGTNSPADLNFNNYKTSGRYSIGNPANYANIPTTTSIGAFVVDACGSYIVQRYTTTANTYERLSFDAGATWSSWATLR